MTELCLSLKALGKMEKDKDAFFVEIREPNEIKRNILESMKDIVEGLQRFEKFKDIRKDKIHNIDRLRKTVKEINKLVADLKSALPESKLRAINLKPVLKEGQKSKSGKKKKHKKSKEPEEKKPVTEIEKLESELGAIEEKLGSLR